MARLKWSGGVPLRLRSLELLFKPLKVKVNSEGISLLRLPLLEKTLATTQIEVGGITYFNGGVTELSLGDVANGGQDLSIPEAVGRVWRVWNDQGIPLNIFLSAASLTPPLPDAPTLVSIFVEGTGTSFNGLQIPARGTAEIVVLAAGTAGASGNSLVAL